MLGLAVLRPDLQIGRYRLINRIGSGGFGEVWAASREGARGRVALKVLHLLEADASGGPSPLERFLAEARVLRDIEHPSIVRVIEVLDLRPGPVAYAMELLEGYSLHELQTRLDLGTLLSIVRQVAEALAFVHRRGVLHRDVKPANIFVCKDADERGIHAAKLIDFGIAKELEQRGMHTATNQLVGTLRSMAPESLDRLNGKDVELTGSVDQWGLGVTLYRALYGKPPFGGETMLAVMNAIKHEPLRIPARTRPNYDPGFIEDELRAVVGRLLEKTPSLRFPSMEAAVEALEELEGILLEGATVAGAPLPQLSARGVRLPVGFEFLMDEADPPSSDEAVPDTVRGRYESSPSALDADTLLGQQWFPDPHGDAGALETDIQIPRPARTQEVDPEAILGIQAELQAEYAGWVESAPTQAPTQVPRGDGLAAQTSPAGIVPVPASSETVRDPPQPPRGLVVPTPTLAEGPLPRSESVTTIAAPEDSSLDLDVGDRTRLWPDEAVGSRRPEDPASPRVEPALPGVSRPQWTPPVSRPRTSARREASERGREASALFANVPWWGWGLAIFAVGFAGFVLGRWAGG